MGKEGQKEMLYWTKEEYLKFADAVMDKPVGECVPLAPEDAVTLYRILHELMDKF